MKKAGRILINILMFIFVWYVSQGAVGFIVGVGLGIAGVEFNETTVMLLAYIGIVTSIVTEVIFWTVKARLEKES